VTTSVQQSSLIVPARQFPVSVSPYVEASGWLVILEISGNCNAPLSENRVFWPVEK
jgi:hypothetical protein